VIACTTSEDEDTKRTYWSEWCTTSEDTKRTHRSGWCTGGVHEMGVLNTPCIKRVQNSIDLGVVMYCEAAPMPATQRRACPCRNHVAIGDIRATSEDTSPSYVVIGPVRIQGQATSHTTVHTPRPFRCALTSKPCSRRVVKGCVLQLVSLVDVGSFNDQPGRTRCMAGMAGRVCGSQHHATQPNKPGDAQFTLQS
jgi:hypothetical protein